VNGHFSPEFSSLGALPPGAKVGSLAAALASRGNGSGTLEEHLARHASFENHAFVALNTAFMEDGAFIDIPKDSVVEKPIALLFVTAPNAQPVVTHPRNLILAGHGSQVSLIEAYVELDAVPPATPGSKVEPRNSPGSAKFDFGISSLEKPYFTNAVTEIVAGESAVIDYSRVQQESESAFHVATVKAQQARSSSVTTYSIALGAALAREEVNAVLDGEGAECLLNGLYAIGGRQHVDNHTVIDHAKPHCGSRELYKGVLDGHSTGVFNGKIIVRKDAQKTDSKQSNKNLLLSEDAVINTKPQLEIFADDVRCTHGATIGQVDPEAIFYLRSRGIGLAEARHLLVEAFAHDVIDRIKFAPLRVRLEEALFARLARSYEPEAN
jgi:Fe-S cluster assembly protein SufD